MIKVLKNYVKALTQQLLISFVLLKKACHNHTILDWEFLRNFFLYVLKYKEGNHNAFCFMDLIIDCLTSGINNNKNVKYWIVPFVPFICTHRTGFTDFLLKMWTPHKTEILSIKNMSKLILVITCVLMSIWI